MKRRAHIDLTPMLDIILLLVFGFMFVIATTNTLLIDKKDDLSEKEQQLITKESELENQIQSNDQLLSEYNQLIEENNVQISTLENINEQNQKEIEQLKTSMQKFFYLNDTEIRKIIAQSKLDSKDDVLNSYSDKYKAAYSVAMYELLANEFYFIDIVIKGESNRIVINDKLTPVTISIEDMKNQQTKNAKMDEIKSQVSQIIDKRVGGSSMTFVTLSTDNDAVLHYAWSTTWSAIKKLEEKYGAKNYYSAELFIN